MNLESNREKNRMIKKIMSIGAVLVTTFIIIVIVMYSGMDSSKANAVEQVYATFTNPMTGKVIKVAQKGSYGKVASKGGKIEFWFFEDKTLYQAKEPAKKGSIIFDKDGNWEYVCYENGTEVSKIKGVGAFDLQGIFELNKVRGYLNVKFCKGKYYTYNNYRLYSNTYVYGEGQSISNLYKSNNSPVFLTFDDSFKDVKGYSGTYNIRMKGLTFNCYTKDIDCAFSSSVLYAAHTMNIIINDVGVINGIGAHVFKLSSVYDAKISNCLFKNLDYIDTTAGYTKADNKFCKAYDIKIGSKEIDREVIQIESDISYEGKNGVEYSMPNALLSRDDTPSKNIIVNNNFFKRVICAVGNHSMDSKNYQENIVIINNLINTTVGDGLRLTKYRNITLKGNKYSNISSSFVGGQNIRTIDCGR